MPIKKIEIHGLNPDHPITQVIDEINNNLDGVVAAINNIEGGKAVVGETGAKGDKGDPGQQGIEGPAGTPGKDGTNGIDGAKGDKGDKGDQGLPGKDGSQGIQGLKGDKGDQGIQGLPGAKGDPGIQGLKGDKGDTGLQGPAGTGLKGSASGYVDAGQFVTLDNLKFSVTTGGARGLCCATVSGTAVLSISATFGFINGVGGSATGYPGATYTTTPSGSWFGWSFPNAGDGSVYLVNDYTNQRFYRVTLMIGAAYLKNFISIERLY